MCVSGHRQWERDGRTDTYDMYVQEAMGLRGTKGRETEDVIMKYNIL